MNAREQARFDMLNRVATFGTNNGQDIITPIPPAQAASAAQTQAKQFLDDLSTPTTGLIDRIADNAKNQATGTGQFRSGTTAKEVLRDALFLELKGINRTAAAIAEAQGKPEIMDKFRMPYGVGEAVLIARASSIADAADAMKNDFIALGHSDKFVDELRDHIKAFINADSTQNTGEETQAGATEEFGPLMDEAMIKVKLVDAFVHQFYKSDAEKLGEWKTASHVERQKKKKNTQQPAPTP